MSADPTPSAAEVIARALARQGEQATLADELGTVAVAALVDAGHLPPDGQASYAEVVEQRDALAVGLDVAQRAISKAHLNLSVCDEATNQPAAYTDESYVRSARAALTGPGNEARALLRRVRGDPT